MQIQQNIPLRQYNTLGIDVAARFFASFASIDDLSALSVPPVAGMPMLVLGGGSNILFTNDFNGLVLKNAVMGIEHIKEDANHVYVKTGAGEKWHGFVEHCIQHNLGGV